MRYDLQFEARVEDAVRTAGAMLPAIVDRVRVETREWNDWYRNEITPLRRKEQVNV